MQKVSSQFSQLRNVTYIGQCCLSPLQSIPHGTFRFISVSLLLLNKYTKSIFKSIVLLNLIYDLISLPFLWRL